MKATLSCWDDQETHAASTAWLLDGEDAGADDTSVAPSLAVGIVVPVAAGLSASVAAPTRRRSGDSLFQSLMRLWPRDGRRPEASARTMARLRSAFRGSLTDLAQAAEARGDVDNHKRIESVLRHIVHSRHPQDLWHLRASVYTEVARALTQGEAERRLAHLNTQFADSRSLLKKLLSRA